MGTTDDWMLDEAASAGRENLDPAHVARYDAKEDAEAAAEVGRLQAWGLDRSTRVRLLSLVAACAGGEACVCDLTEAVGLSQPTVSHHLKHLVDAGLLSREQRGKWGRTTPSFPSGSRCSARRSLRGISQPIASWNDGATDRSRLSQR